MVRGIRLSGVVFRRTSELQIVAIDGEIIQNTSPDLTTTLPDSYLSYLTLLVPFIMNYLNLSST